MGGALLRTPAAGTAEDLACSFRDGADGGGAGGAGVTEGAACTVLLARDLIDNDDPLMIANSDQWVDMDINEYLAAMDRTPEDDDPSNKLVAVRDHVDWLRAIGFADVDCFWKWRELALVSGTKPE